MANELRSKFASNRCSIALCGYGALVRQACLRQHRPSRPRSGISRRAQGVGTYERASKCTIPCCANRFMYARLEISRGWPARRYRLVRASTPEVLHPIKLTIVCIWLSVLGAKTLLVTNSTLQLSVHPISRRRTITPSKPRSLVLLDHPLASLSYRRLRQNTTAQNTAKRRRGVYMLIAQVQIYEHTIAHNWHMCVGKMQLCYWHVCAGRCSALPPLQAQSSVCAALHESATTL